jgi:hypothetical protein
MGWIQYRLRDHLDTRTFDLAGCQTVADAVWVIGSALRASVPGSTTSVASALASVDAENLVLNARHASTELVVALHSSISLLVPRKVWWAAVREAIPLSNHVACPEPWPEMPEEFPFEADAAAWLPSSQRRTVQLDTALQEIDSEKPSLRADLAAHLRDQPIRSVGAIADAALSDHQDLFGIAVGDLPSAITPSDLFGLRLIAEAATDSNVACLAAAAAARIRGQVGQPTEALARIDQGMSRTTMADPVHRALLVWAEAIVQLGIGDTTTASIRFKAATQQVHGQRDLNLLATMHRQWGDRLSARGLTSEAAAHLRTARGLYRRQGNPEGIAASLRGAADLAVSVGETLSAEALYDQAEMNTTTDTETANRLLGRASLAIAMGDWDAVSQRLSRVRRMGLEHPGLLANLKRREADKAFRTGDLVSGAHCAQAAHALYCQAGSPEAAARCTRLMADAAALQGDLDPARVLYREAALSQIRTGDWLGLQRSIRHIAEISAPEIAKALRQITTELVVLEGTP